jgi:predicted heme/steroid binding protein
MPLRPISLAELRRCNGDRGAPCWVAVGGRVYDVSGCPKWRSGMHEGLHFPGQVLDDELPDAPHAHEVFDRPCVVQVGWLVVDRQDNKRTDG